MKKMKKLFAVILSLAMVLGMCMVTSAAEVPTSGDKTTISVEKVEANATVTAYKITEATYAEGRGFVGFKRVDQISADVLPDANVLQPTADQISALAAEIATISGLEKLELNESVNEAGNTVYSTNQATAGYWIVVVTGTESKTIYNPMLLGAYYVKSGSDNTMSNENVDASSRWDLNGQTGYAKSDEPQITKEIVNPGSGNVKGDDVAINDTVNFKIETDIPSYSEEYTNGTYKITDRVNGLTEIDNINVYLNNTDGNPIEAEGHYTLTKNDTDFTLDFDFTYIKTFAETPNQKFIVTYTSKLTDETKVNFDASTNTATLEYSNGFDVDGVPTTTTKDDKTYHYTFAIDAGAAGDLTETWNKTTEELVKTGEKTITTESGSETKKIRLEGAEFKLTRSDAPEGATGAPYVFTATSDVNGRLNFKGLDAGEYTLIETAAPDGFSINPAEVKVEIKADYNKDGTLNQYQIIVGEGTDKKTSTYKGQYGENGAMTGIEYNSYKTIEVPNKDNEMFEGEGRPGDVNGNTPSETYEFLNTTLASLPSTGGIGTTIFTIGGCIIMIVAAGLFFASRRKSSAK